MYISALWYDSIHIYLGCLSIWSGIMRNLYAIYVPKQLGCWLPAEDIPRIVKEAIPKLCLDAVLPFIYQLAARLDMKDISLTYHDFLKKKNVSSTLMILWWESISRVFSKVLYPPWWESISRACFFGMSGDTISTNLGWFATSLGTERFSRPMAIDLFAQWRRCAQVPQMLSMVEDGRRSRF